jgi:hypothetical protein
MPIQMIHKVLVVIVLAGALGLTEEPQSGGFIKIIPVRGVIAGQSKAPQHLGWIKLSKVQYASSSPGVSIVTKGAGSKSSGPASSSSPNAGDNVAVDKGLSDQSPQSQSHANVPNRSVARSQASQDRASAGQRLVITKDVDKSSARLKQAFASGERFKEVIVDFYRGGAPIHLDLANVRVLSIVPIPATHHEPATETVTLIAIPQSSDDKH